MYSDGQRQNARTSRGKESPQRYAGWLWVLLALFCLRVIGQMLVAFLHVSFLPPMEEWYSGLIPYPWLLMSQFFIILVFGKVCIDFTRREGFFVVPRRALGSGLLTFGSVYFGVMVVRYVIRMSLYPQERWMGGSIPLDTRELHPFGWALPVGPDPPQIGETLVSCRRCLLAHSLPPGPTDVRDGFRRCPQDVGPDKKVAELMRSTLEVNI